MELVDALTIVFVAVFLLGLFARRLHPSLERQRRLLLIVGGVGVLLLVAPEFVRGLVNGFRDAGRHSP